MNRRELLSSIGGATGLALVSREILAAEQAPKGEHQHEHAGATPHSALIRAAHECLAAGDVCLKHCIDRFAQGDKSMAACARADEQMLAFCAALSKLAAQNAPRLKEFATLCATSCRDCETECRKHEQHAACKRCAEACVKCATECDRVA